MGTEARKWYRFNRQFSDTIKNAGAQKDLFVRPVTVLLCQIKALSSLFETFELFSFSRGRRVTRAFSGDPQIVCALCLGKQIDMSCSRLKLALVPFSTRLKLIRSTIIRIPFSLLHFSRFFLFKGRHQGEEEEV